MIKLNIKQNGFDIFNNNPLDVSDQHQSEFDKAINNKVAITGEICLQGSITAIGGLDLKILGGIKGGVKTFLFPKENDKDFNDFFEKYKDKNILNGINFVQVETIYQVLELVFEH